MAAFVSFVGCDEPPKHNPFDVPASAPKPTPKLTEAPKPQGPPQFVIDNQGPKVGFERVLVDKPDGAQRLEKTLGENKEHIDGKELVVVADRQAKTPHVAQFLTGLAAHGATSFVIRTKTRDEYPKELTFTPQDAISSPPPCAAVATILNDRATAVWKLDGGTASKRKRGFAGPDLSMTGETLLRRAKGCKSSDLLYVQADAEVEWGLTYDLAASAKALEETPFKRFVLLKETPIAGRPVKL